MLLYAALLAVLIGVALGLLGGGGSILTVPILVYVLGLEAHVAVATSLFVVGVTALAASVGHARAGRISLRTALLFGPASMVGAYGGGKLAHRLPGPLLLGAFGLMMLVTSLAMLRGRRKPAAGASTSAGPVLLRGVLVGAVTGLVGAGGGFLVVPALVLLGGLPMEVAVGTSLLVIAMNSFAALAGHLSHARLDWTVAGIVTAAAVGGSFIGGALASRVSPERLRRAFGWFVLAMAAFMLTQQVPPALGAAMSKKELMQAALGLALFATFVGVLVERRRARSTSDAP